MLLRILVVYPSNEHNYVLPAIGNSYSTRIWLVRYMLQIGLPDAVRQDLEMKPQTP